MKSERKILIAFILNFVFSIFEFIGGAITGSVAIASDAVHDAGDALSIALSFILERKSKKEPDETYTYGYARYSVMGSVITTVILLVGSLGVMIGAVKRVVNPVEIDYDNMINFAVVGALVNVVAALLTGSGYSLNQKAVNLHMLEDVLGWVVVLIGAVVMRFTDISVLDPLMSIGVSLFIFVNAFRNLKEAVDLFLEKTPHGIEIDEIKEHIKEIEGVKDIHHIHIWSMDGYNNYLTMHVVTDDDGHVIKEKIRKELREHGISHATLELEGTKEHCHHECCFVESSQNPAGHHHHHHGHHHH